MELNQGQNMEGKIDRKNVSIEIGFGLYILFIFISHGLFVKDYENFTTLSLMYFIINVPDYFLMFSPKEIIMSTSLSYRTLPFSIFQVIIGYIIIFDNQLQEPLLILTWIYQIFTTLVCLILLFTYLKLLCC
jgi:hypothetical protein